MLEDTEKETGTQTQYPAKAMWEQGLELEGPAFLRSGPRGCEGWSSESLQQQWVQ